MTRPLPNLRILHTDLSHTAMLGHRLVRGMGICIWVLVNLDIDMGRASASTAMPRPLYYTPG